MMRSGLLLAVLLLAPPALPAADQLHIIKLSTPAEMREFLRYAPDRIPLVSAHRGGPRPGFPENCIATFENTLRHVHAILEVDPRLTKDGVAVLMHDPTLDRTTTGTGKLADHTWEQLKRLKLKDTEGKATPYGMATLDEALDWAKGKTILVLDRKSVPVEMTARIIAQHKAETCAMVIAYTYAEARRYHELNKNIMMEVFMADSRRAAQFDAGGVPWESIVAFVTQSRPQDASIYELIHRKGALCIVGSHRSHDQEFLSGKNKRIYEELIRDGADIIEADRAIEAAEAIRQLAPKDSSKSRFFGLLAAPRPDP